MATAAESNTLTVQTNLQDYPVTMAIKDGRVTSPLVTLSCCGPKTAHNGFKDLLRNGKYNASELAIVTYLQAKTYGKPWVLIPAPVHGRQQHHCAGYNIEFGELRPKDIEGRLVGVRTYAQTTGLWIRGILQHEYGVDLDKITYLTVDEGHLAEYQDPPNCRRLPPGSDIGAMMLKGEVAAALMGNDLPKDPRVRTLISEPHEAAQRWFEREGVVPINHLFVVHADIAKRRPDVVREIFRMLVEARNLAPAEAVKDLPPLGYEANKKGIDLAVQWAFEQKIIPRRFKVDELFDDTTASLNV
jgi:4,5-dihydroxyphthalate decarboxylase